MFKVEKIIDGNTIVVNPEWKFSNLSGNSVVVRGYNPIFAHDVSKKWNDKDENMLANRIAKQRLEFLINEKFVDLRNGSNQTSECIDTEGRLKCYVYLDNVDISRYFVEFDK